VKPLSSSRILFFRAGLTACLLALVFLSYPTPRVSAGKQRISPVTVNSVRLLLDDAYFAALVPALRQARQRIDIAMFLFKVNNEYPDNRPAMIVRELADAVKRGVKVQMVLERSKKDLKLNATHERVAELLQQSGVTVRFDSPRTTSHGKLVVIDRRLVFLGSHNFTHSALSRNHEISVLLEDSRLAQQLLQSVF